MAPPTLNTTPPVPQVVSTSLRSPQTVLTSRNPTAGGSSSTQKQPTTGTSTVRSTHLLGSTATRKPSTVSPSTRRSTSSAGRSTTPKTTVISTLQSNTPNVQVSTSTVVVSSTTRRIPVISPLSPGGIHPNYSTALPPISQGQHGTSSGGSEGTNTAAIVAGVLVPLILVGIGALIFYVWYRRKYPVRMVLGRDFNRFSNPAYNKRASTVTLVRNDGQQAWDTLSRRNPDLAFVEEDEPDGINNLAFEIEKDENNEEVTAEERMEVKMVNSAAELRQDGDQEDMAPNVGISRERPKTKKAVLVKTDTMEDLENGFELVTESDLGHRTESEVSSGNDSTETHTISLTFSETFDDRHKENRTDSDMLRERTEHLKESENYSSGDDSSENEKDNSSMSTLDDKAVGNIESAEKDRIIIDNDSNEKDTGSQNNESFEIIADGQLDTELAKEEKLDDVEHDTHNTLASEILSEENCYIDVEADGEKTTENNENFDLDFTDTVNQTPMSVISELSENLNDDSFDFPQDTKAEMKVNLTVESAEKCSDDIETSDVRLESKTGHNAIKSFEDDNSFEVVSDFETSKVENLNIVQENNEFHNNVKQKDMNVIEKEKTEILEKENLSLEACNLPGLSIVNSKSRSHEDVSVISDSQNGLKLSIKPTLTLSNENIVLDSVPQTPTVLVQESFILENESPIPVYLDSMSPARGRRAFTLNDISKQKSIGVASSEFGSQMGNHTISKSSPVISALTTPVHKNRENVETYFENKDSKVKTNKSSKDSEIRSADEASKETKDEQNRGDFKLSEICRSNELNDSQTGMSTSDPFVLPELNDLENNTKENVLSLERNDMFESIDSDSFDFDRDKSNTVDLDISVENFSFNDIETDKSEHVTPDEHSVLETDKILHKGHQSNKLDTLLLDAGNFTAGETFENTANQPQHLDDKVELTTSKDSFDEDNPFFGDFPPTSTPNASVVVDSKTDTNESKRKKVVPQTFDFENSGDSDTESSKSETSSELVDVGVMNSTSLVDVFDENKKSLDPFEIDAFSNPTDSAESVDLKSNAAQQKVDLFKTDDILSLTGSTNSSTGLSWELLSTENSQDSRNTSQENPTSVLLDLSESKDQNNESISGFTFQSEKAGVFDTETEISTQSHSNNTSVGTVDVSWEVVDEVEDNSEC